MMHFLFELCFGNMAGLSLSFFWIPMAVGAALGAGKNIEDQRQASAQRKASAEMNRWSPWTGMQGQNVKDPSLFGNIATGAAIGASAGKMFPGGAADAAGASTGSFSAANGIEGAAGAAGQGAAMDASQYNLSQGSNPSSFWMQMAKKYQQPSLYSNNQ